MTIKQILMFPINWITGRDLIPNSIYAQAGKSFILLLRWLGSAAALSVLLMVILTSIK